MKYVALLVAGWMLLPAAMADEKPNTATKEQPAATPAKETAPADGLHPHVKMETSLGDFVLELDAEKAPVSVQNFIQYIQEGFYNGTTFHRVISNFMIQGGGFSAEMTKKTEGLRPPIANEWKNGLKNQRGTIAMARLGGRPDSATSQFFINVVDNGSLDQPRDGAAYAVFGKVIEGMDIVDKIREVKTQPHPKNPQAGRNAPAEPIIIEKVTVVGGYDADKLAAQLKVAEQRRKEAQAKADAEKALLAAAFKKTLETGKDAEGRELHKTDSGLRYAILKEGAGPSPEPTDRVKVHYTGWLMDGTKFDSSVDRGQPAKFPLNRVIKGWTEGVGMMKVGGKRRLFIPYDIAYGERGRPPTIPAKAMLVFDVELLGIVK